QAAIGPLPLVLETGDQVVDREGIAPGRFHAAETRRLVLAGAADHALSRQRHCAEPAVRPEPGQLGFAGGADAVCGVIRDFVAELALAAWLQPGKALQKTEVERRHGGSSVSSGAGSLVGVSESASP